MDVSSESSPTIKAADEAAGTQDRSQLDSVPVDNGAGTSSNERRKKPPSRQVSNVQPAKTKAGIFGTSANMVNSIVGAGIIGIPYAVRQSGLVLGVLLLALVGYLTDKSLRTIIELASFHPKLKGLGVLTYEDLMGIPFGRTGRAFILANMFILAYGAMVAYLLIIKDTIPTILGWAEAGVGGFVERELTMVITSLVIMLPLSMLRDIASLAFTSFLSVTADVILVSFVIAYAPIKESVSNAGGFGEVLKDNWANNKLFIGLGVLSTAMACQHSAFIVSGSLKDRTAARWATVTARSIAFATLLSGLMGIFGYLGFLGDTQGDILNNFDSDSLAANAGRALLAVTMFFTYPMESLVARHVIGQLFYSGNLDNVTIGPNGEVVKESKWFGCFGRREFVTFLIYLATLVPALIVDDLGPVLSLTGSIGASCVAYIGPGLVYLGLNGDDFLERTANTLQSLGYKGGNKAKRPEGNSGDIELPVVGDANATMTTATPPAEAVHPSSLSKPWWWFPVGYPLWVAIASAGEHGTKSFLADHHKSGSNDGDNDDDEDQQHPEHDGGDHHGQDEEASSSSGDEIIGPRQRDYFISMFFILFGIVALVLGVASNIWIQIHDVFYTPT